MGGPPKTTVYLDHGATSWPKPRPVVDAVVDALTVHGASPGRGAYAMGLAASRLVHRARGACASLLGVPDLRDVIFVPGCTYALNLALKGLLRPGDRVVVSSVEHNAVVRPLHATSIAGVAVEVVEADANGLVDADAVEAAVRAAPTRLVVCQHASNVTGAIQPVADLADIAHAAGALMVVDGAQACGHLPVDLSSIGADAYAVSGHKGMLGPQGIGLLCLSPSCEPVPLVEGGTGGASSASPEQPSSRPERFESGTPNTPGIAGLGAAAAFLAKEGDGVRAREARLTARLHEAVLEIGGFRVLGPVPGEPRVPIVTMTHDQVDADRLAFLLDKRYGIAVRAGLHCAPWVHRTLGTIDKGALRLGLGWSTTDDDVDLVIGALRDLVS
ncbi:MAG: aminotransferase class V-fold PLP-dependent enzyme [Coriobacteriia bacterium]